MKYVFYILFLLMILLSLEWRASYCGQGVVRVVLPGGVQPEWFNGRFQLNDNEGWHFFYPGLVLNKEGDYQKNVGSIDGYGFDEHNIYVRYRLGNNDDNMESIRAEKIVFNSLEGSYKFSEVHPGDVSESVTKWFDTRPNSCFWGRWNFIRMFLIFVIFGFLMKLVIKMLR